MTEPAVLVAESRSAAPAPVVDRRYRVRVGNVRDGRLYGLLPVSAATGSCGINGAGKVNLTVPDTDRTAQLYRMLPPGKSLWCLEWVDGTTRRLIDGGVLWNRGAGDAATWTGAGMFSLLNARPLVASVPNDQVAATSLTYSNLDHGSIMAAIVGQVLGLSGGSLPITLQAARTGTRTRTYDGFDVASAGQRIDELSQVEPGTEFLMLPRYADPASSAWVTFDFLTGTETAPQLTNTVPWRLNGTAPGQQLVGAVSVEDSAAEMASTAWAAGGGEEKAKVIRAATDTTLTDAGWPRLEQVTTNEATDTARVQGYANQALARLRRPLRTVKVQASAAWWWGTGARLGDKVHLTADHRIAGRVDVTSRVLSVGWDVTSQWVSLELADTLAEEGI